MKQAINPKKSTDSTMRVLKDKQDALTKRRESLSPDEKTEIINSLKELRDVLKKPKGITSQA